MKKTLVAIMLVAAIACFARPHHHHHHRGSDSVWLAAGIVNLVAGGLRILNPPPTVIVQQPVYAPPVYQVVPQPVQVVQPVVPAPVVTTPVVTTPVVTPIPTYVAPQPIIMPQRPVLLYRYSNGMEVYGYR